MGDRAAHFDVVAALIVVVLASVLSLGGGASVARAGQSAGAASGKSSSKATNSPHEHFACQAAEDLFASGRISASRKDYESVGQGEECAKNGLKEVRKVERLCSLGKAEEAVHLRAEALTAYKEALALSPKAGCAVIGVRDEAGSDWFESALQWVSVALPRAPVALAALAGLPIALFILLMILGWPRIKGRRLPLERMWPLRTLLRPRITFASIADQDVQLDGSGTKWKIGASMAAQIRERLQRFREDALSDQSPDMDLDFGSSGESIAKLVSNESPLKNALDKVGETSEGAKLVTGLLDLVYTLLPIRRLSISGALGPPVDNCACATLSIEGGPQLEAAITLKHRLANDANVTSADYMRLVDPAAVWVKFEVTRALARTSEKVGSDQPDSYTRLREGLARHTAGEAVPARVAFEEALTLEPDNWSAAIDLATTEARLTKDYKRAIAVLERAWEGLRAYERESGAPSSLGNHYRLAYQLAAQRMHLFLTDPSKDQRAAAVAGLKPLIRNARTMKRELRKRERPSWLRRNVLRQGLDPTEQRLLKFLTRAVIPSAILLLRAIEHSQGRDVDHDDVLDEVPEICSPTERTYRAMYSVACFEVAFAGSVAGEADVRSYFERALDALREVLCGAQGGTRRELRRWAKSDPALAGLRESSLQSGAVTYGERFEELIERYSVEGAAPVA